MHAPLCVCPLLPRLETRTRVVLLVHHKEERKTTNTGRIATLALTNSELVRRGDRGAPPPALTFAHGSAPLFLFPHEDATPIDAWATRDRRDKPVILIVPDGTWRQASKVRKRVPALAGVPCVSLPEGGVETRYRLRAEQKPGGLATIEAIARVLGVLEGPSVEQALLTVFDAMVERTLWTRGALHADDVRSGLPLSGSARSAGDP
jgi:DTW domain-containing protein